MPESVKIIAKTWNPSPQKTQDLLIITKLTALGSADSKKTILGLIVTLTQATSAAASGKTPPNYNIKLSFRDGTEGQWISMHNFSSVYLTDAAGTREAVINFTNPIRDIRHFQLKISGHSRGEFGINDISVIFREYRDTNVTKLDEE